MDNGQWTIFVVIARLAPQAVAISFLWDGKPVPYVAAPSVIARLAPQAVAISKTPHPPRADVGIRPYNYKPNHLVGDDALGVPPGKCRETTRTQRPPCVKGAVSEADWGIVLYHHLTIPPPLKRSPSL